MKRLLLPLLLFCTSLWSTLPPDPAVRVGTLSTGISYYIWPCSQEEGCSPHDRICLRLVVPIGSGVEQEGEEGIAHFVEHILFRGSEHFSESDIEYFITAAGGGEGADANAFTSFDATAYLLNLPPGDWSLVETGLAIFADFAERARIDDWSVEAERGIVLEEWRLGRNAHTRVMEERLGALFDGSPYADRLPIGLEETVRKATSNTLRTFYNRWYRQVPIAIIATGPCDPDLVEAAIHNTFGSPTFPDRPRTRPDLPCPIPYTRHLISTQDPELTWSTIEVSFKRETTPLQNEEDLKQALIASSYHALIHKRLSRLQEVGFLPAEAIYIGRDRPLNCLETDTFELLCTPEQTTEALEALLQEIHLASLYGFTVNEWGRACVEAQMEIRGARLEGEHKSPTDLANQCFAHFVSGSTLCSQNTLFDACERLYPTITLDDLHTFARSLGTPQDAFICITAPAGRHLPESEIEALLERTERRCYFPYEELMLELPSVSPSPGRLTEEHTLANPEIITLTAANGMTIHLLPTTDKRDIICEGIALGGLSDYPQSDRASSKLASSLLDESGIGGLTPSELNSALAGIDVALSRDITTYTRTLTGGSHPEDVETLFQLLHLTFTQQVNRPEIFDRLIARQVTYSKLGDTPLETLHKMATEITRSGAPYFSRPDWESATFERTNEIATSAFSNPADFTLNFVGPFDPANMRTLVTKYLASIPSQAESSTTYTPLDAPFPRGITHKALYRGTEAQSTVELYFPLSLPDLSPTTVTLANAALGLIRSRVHHVLREALSATYHVDADARLRFPNPKGGILCLSFSCNPEDANLLTQVALRELRKLKEGGPTPTEIQARILQVDRQITEGMRTNAFWSGELCAAVLTGRDLEELEQLESRSLVLTRQATHEMIQRLLPLDNYVTLTLYPEE